MITAGQERREYRVWIVRYEAWEPRDWSDVPAEAIAIEPAEEEALSAADVAPFLEGFNRAALAEGERRWAVALPVRLKYEGDPRPGERIRLGENDECRRSNDERNPKSE